MDLKLSCMVFIQTEVFVYKTYTYMVDKNIAKTGRKERKATSALDGSVSGGSSILVGLEFGDVGFCGGRKTREPGEKRSEQGENQQQTQPTYGKNPR